MKKNNFRVSITFITLLIFCNYVFAEENIDLSNKANSIWDCNMSDQYFKGEIRFYFKDVSGKKVNGESTWCFVQRGENAKLKGKLKKDTLKFSLSVKNAGNDCPNISGKMKFSRDASGKFTASGNYTSQYQKGPMNCKVSEFN